MPKLKCEVKNCIYNCDEYCAKSVIHVNNDLDAKKCISFSLQKYQENDYNSEFASMDGLNQYVSIECEAKNCDYNCKGSCVSENVKIGTHNKSYANGAKCKTFSL